MEVCNVIDLYCIQHFSINFSRLFREQKFRHFLERFCLLQYKRVYTLHSTCQMSGNCVPAINDIVWCAERETASCNNFTLQSLIFMTKRAIVKWFGCCVQSENIVDFRKKFVSYMAITMHLEMINVIDRSMEHSHRCR